MLYILPTNTCFGIACPISEIENYKKIFEIKKRDFRKPIAILVSDFNYFIENTKLNFEQINFLKNYNNPFTILIDKEKILDKSLLEIINNLPNSEIYSKIAFRVAHNFMHKKLIRLNGLLFLTSANISNNPELFDTISIKKEFGDIIEKEEIKVLAHGDFCINSEKKSSDIFEFEGENEEVVYFRK
ncbi:MAG: Sua5/YciO/YrdC/YwlC family protein [Candidatus Gracilibacteria bacterium]|nr:Sua5/YciO/YrdC/YwlC family protein [Candidatus Gracilibacteria bacterium]